MYQKLCHLYRWNKFSITDISLYLVVQEIFFRNIDLDQSLSSLIKEVINVSLSHHLFILKAREMTQTCMILTKFVRTQLCAEKKMVLIQNENKSEGYHAFVTSHAKHSPARFT